MQADDFSAGEQSTLRQLHTLVPATEEVDILEDSREAAHRAEVRQILEEAAVPLDDPPDDSDDSPAPAALALLREQLGATVIGEYTTPGL